MKKYREENKEKIKEQKNKYMKKYREENKDKIKERNKNMKKN